MNREVALATGESVATIDSLGFVPLTHSPVEYELLTVDWWCRPGGFSNVASQGYLWEDAQLKRPKVKATRQLIQRIDPHISTEVVVDRYRPKLDVSDVVFCCVDSITMRAAIWRSLRHRVRFWADGRMMAETIRVLAVADDASRQHYSGTLFPQSEAQQGSCSSRSTIYAANIAAGLMLHQFTRWLRDLPVEPDMLLNLLAGEWSVATA